MYRNIYEMTNMRNNDERVAYSENKQTREDEPLIRPRNGFEHPRLVISRPVLLEEIDAGISTNWRGSVYEEDVPALTKALDDFHKLKRQLDFKMACLDLDLTAAVRWCVSESFYDCMSGGAGYYYLSACRWFIENEDLDLDTEIYPGDDGWHTFADFLKEIEDIPRLESMVSKLPTAKLLGTENEDV